MEKPAMFYFNRWLTLMESAYENLDGNQFRNLEDRIIGQIKESRKSRGSKIATKTAANTLGKTRVGKR